MSNTLNDLTALADTASRSWAKHGADITARHTANPHNGTLGWWRVEGIRHAALVKASSAMQAIENARDVVDPSWEFPEAFWVGVELPEVFAI